MKIFKLTYEEIDTEDKFNPEKNIKLTCQYALSDYELEMMGIRNDTRKLKDFSDCIKTKLIDQII